jgi:hypothetical protein
MKKKPTELERLEKRVKQLERENRELRAIITNLSKREYPPFQPPYPQPIVIERVAPERSPYQPWVTWCGDTVPSANTELTVTDRSDLS